MSNRRKVEKSRKEIVDKEVYCDTRNCPYKQCLRRLTNAPFDELVQVVRYEFDKNGKCEGLLEE